MVVTLTWLLSEVSAQVNSEIDQFEDLLAVDSFANEVSQADAGTEAGTDDFLAGDRGQT